jgi:hypothetical protein
MLMRGVTVLHNGALPCVAHTVHDTLWFKCLEVLDYPTCSPDLSACDFHVFGLVMAAVMEWFQQQPRKVSVGESIG